MAKRRLTKTAVLEAIRKTHTTQFVDKVGPTLKGHDGRHEVDIRLFDVLDTDPRQTPAGAALIGHLESSGWVVHHNPGRRYSSLTVFEPVASPDSPKED